MANYKYVGDRCADGVIIGYDSSEPIAFYGGTPTTRNTAPTAPATTGAVSTTTGAITSWGFSTSTQANAISVAVADIITILTDMGMVA